MDIEFTSPSRVPIGTSQRHDDMSLDAVFRPNMVVLAGLCLLICVVDLHVLRRRKQPSGPLTLQHAALGSLSLLCSLICAIDSILLSMEDGWICWEPALVGSLWAMVCLLRLCYLAVPTNRQFYFVNANLLGLAIFFTTSLPEKLYPLVWFQAKDNGYLSMSDSVQLVAAFSSAIILPLLTTGHHKSSDNELRPAELCSPVSRWWLYTWVSPMVNKGHAHHGVMSTGDLLPTSGNLSADAWLQTYSSCRQTVSSFKATLWRLFRWRLAVSAFWAAFCGFFELIGTIGLRQLLLFLQKSPDTKFHPWFSILLFGCCPILRGLCMQTFEYFATHTIGDGKACITTAVYRKLMTLQANSAVDVGQLQSNISADIDRLGTLRYSMMTGFMVPVELIVASILLYKIMGWYYLPSLAFLLVTRYPLSKLIVSAQTKTQSNILKATDRRITSTSESIRAMAAIKIHGHVQPFIQRIIGERNRELEAIWRKMQVIVASEGFSSVFTFFALLLCLLLYTIVGKKPLEPNVVFTLVAVFNIVNSMLSLSVLGAGQYAQAMVSLSRLSTFLDQPDSQVAKAYAKDETVDMDGTGSTTVRSSSCKEPGKLDADLVASGLNVITGDVGSGKTLLLHSLLFDRQKLQKAQFEPIAYASQNPWLFRGSIRDNILFGAPFDQERYEKVIRVCALDMDLSTFQDSDMKEVGEDGRRLSGGQRQRITLARAVYSNTGTVILDDVLSGLDPVTLDWIVNNCILGPHMKGRTLVVVSHSEKLLENADMIVHMEDGAVSKFTRRSPVKNGYTIDDEGDSFRAFALDSGPHRKQSTDIEENEENNEDNGETPEDLDNLQGRIGLKYVGRYIRSFGSRTFIATVAIFTIGAQAMDIVLPTWLSVWSQTYTKDQTTLNLGYLIGIFTGLGFLRLSLLAISLVLLYSGAWRASRDKHLEMLVVVFGATYAWIWRTPAGQAINRFSSDMASLDDTLFRTLRPVIETYLSITFRILTVSSLIPLFLVPSIAFTGIALRIGHRYRFASTAVKHMYAASLTPLHHSITETASGLMTIHAFRAEKILQDRFNVDVDHHVRTWNAVSDLQRWLAVRMDICVGMISFSVAMLAIMRQDANASTVGLSLTLTTGLCTALLYLVYLSSLLEVEMTSYYRIETYIKDLPQESGPCDPNTALDENWPTHGAVHVENLTAGYSLDEDAVLKGIDFKALAGERVAIVGRTGSGKSSLALSLLRLTTRLHGSVTIDGVDVESLEVDRLRQHISLIPQDPTLFDGTMRFNLDPSGRECDEHLQVVLNDVVGTPDKWHLDDLVEGNGKNLSHGERQLIALARAIVSQNRIVILDEGTASLDQDSEARIHAVLRARFSDCTVIAISHQLHSVLDFDRVLVLDQGRVAEQGNPRELLITGNGWFQTLYMQQDCSPDDDPNPAR